MVGKTDLKTKTGMTQAVLDATVQDAGGETPVKQQLVAPETTKMPISPNQSVTATRSGGQAMLDARMTGTVNRRKRGAVRQKRLQLDNKPLTRLEHGAVGAALDDIGSDIDAFKAGMLS